jgi:hypothetical protein
MAGLLAAGNGAATQPLAAASAAMGQTVKPVVKTAAIALPARAN